MNESRLNALRAAPNHATPADVAAMIAMIDRLRRNRAACEDAVRAAIPEHYLDCTTTAVGAIQSMALDLASEHGTVCAARDQAVDELTRAEEQLEAVRAAVLSLRERAILAATPRT